MTIGLIDYGAGNLRSVHNALIHLGAGDDVRLVAGEDDLQGVDKLIYPGVGAFGDSVKQLRAQGLFDPIQAWLAADRPFFGICIGFQVLFEGSEEAPGVSGLGQLKGQVVRFADDPPGLKIPHMGWNKAAPTDPADPAWDGLGADPHFYFVHSYYPEPEDGSLVAARTTYGNTEFVSAIRQGNVFATQFHPEKSQTAGLRLIENFIRS